MSSADRLFPVRPSRRQLLTLGVGAFVVASLPLARGHRRRLCRRCLPVMGTLADVAAVHADPRVAQAALDAAHARLRFVDAGMSRFSPRSDVGRANRLAAREPVEVSAHTAHVLAAALAWARATDGAFDPCLGQATELWDVTERNQPPAQQAVDRLAGRRLFESLRIDVDGPRPRVRFDDPDVRLDLGGIAKGYGVDLAVAALREHGVEQGFVNVGGDLYALGVSEDGDPWRVGIRSADAADATGAIGATGAIRATLEIADAAVATSGDSQRFFEHGGRRYHHLLDPTSAAPRQAATHGLSVKAASCLTADAAATALFGMPRSGAEALLARCAPDAAIV